MNKFDFDLLVESRCVKIKEVLTRKAAEYATENRFHNFIVGGRKANITPESALMGMKLKHDVSVDDLVSWAGTCPEKLTLTLIDEKIGDSINYLILLEGLLKERVQGGL